MKLVAILSYPAFVKIPQKRLFILLLSFIAANLYAQFPPTPVHVAQASIEELSPTSWFAGTVVSQNDAQIAAEVSGRLIELARIGSRIQKGDVIARIDDEPLRLKKKELLATVKSARFRLDFLESEVERQTSLIGRNMTAKTELDKTIADRDVARENLVAEESRLAQTEKQLHFTVLRAPFNGVITHRLSQIGELVNNATAIARLVETEDLEITAQIPLTSYPFIKKGMKIAVKSSLGVEQGIVSALVPVADKRSHQMEMRLDIAAISWPVGLDVRVAVPIGPLQTALTVSRDALVFRRQGTSVFRINKDNAAEQINVTIGLGVGPVIEVKGDIKEGDKIVIRGAERLRPGQTVAIKETNDNLVPL